MGAFADFLASKGIEPKQILAASARLESVRDEDRELIRARRKKRRTQAGKSYEELQLAKPRSGRPLREGHVEAALADKPVPGPVRTKLVRAINALVEKKGGEPVRAPQLFGDVPGRQGKKPRSA
jgi:hypothetical protein